jgi:hypothetical protein
MGACETRVRCVLLQSAAGEERVQRRADDMVWPTTQSCLPLATSLSLTARLNHGDLDAVPLTHLVD